MFNRPCTNKANITFHQLGKLAFFFAMRSCEYLKVTGERRTDALRVRNFEFRKRNRILDHSDPNLASADTITLTFEFQKNENRDDPITQSSTNDPLMCPVRAAAAVIQRLRAEGATPDTHIYQYNDDRGRKKELTGTLALSILRTFIKTIDKAYGILPSQVGLHSFRASSAMAMYMNKIPTVTIMLIGRWSSDAFILYIRKQVLEFSSNVSGLMLHNGTYHQVQKASKTTTQCPQPRIQVWALTARTSTVVRSRFGDETEQTPLSQAYMFQNLEQRDFITDVALVESPDSHLANGTQCPHRVPGQTTGTAH